MCIETRNPADHIDCEDRLEDFRDAYGDGSGAPQVMTPEDIADMIEHDATVSLTMLAGDVERPLKEKPEELFYEDVDHID